MSEIAISLYYITLSYENKTVKTVKCFVDVNAPSSMSIGDIKKAIIEQFTLNENLMQGVEYRLHVNDKIILDENSSIGTGNVQNNHLNMMLEPSTITVNFCTPQNKIISVQKVPIGSTIRQALAIGKISATDFADTVTVDSVKLSIDTILKFENSNAEIKLFDKPKKITFGKPKPVNIDATVCSSVNVSQTVTFGKPKTANTDTGVQQNNSSSTCMTQQQQQYMNLGQSTGTTSQVQQQQNTHQEGIIGGTYTNVTGSIIGVVKTSTQSTANGTSGQQQNMTNNNAKNHGVNTGQRADDDDDDFYTARQTAYN